MYVCMCVKPERLERFAAAIDRPLRQQLAATHSRQPAKLPEERQDRQRKTHRSHRLCERYVCRYVCMYVFSSCMYVCMYVYLLTRDI